MKTFFFAFTFFFSISLFSQGVTLTNWGTPVASLTSTQIRVDFPQARATYGNYTHIAYGEKVRIKVLDCNGDFWNPLTTKVFSYGHFTTFVISRSSIPLLTGGCSGYHITLEYYLPQYGGYTGGTEWWLAF